MLMQMNGSSLFIFFFISLNAGCISFLMDLTTGGFVDQGGDCPHACKIWLSLCAMYMLCAPGTFFEGAACAWCSWWQYLETV